MPAPRKKAASSRRASRAAIEFNHAMIYTSRLDRSLGFYRDRLGFKVVDEYPGMYARLKSRKGSTTLALHLLDPGMKLDTRNEGIRLYFEIAGLAAFCARLRRQGVRFMQMPRRMPWGWTHAYLKDPDGHEVSLFSAGEARLRPTLMEDE